MRVSSGDAAVGRDPHGEIDPVVVASFGSEAVHAGGILATKTRTAFREVSCDDGTLGRSLAFLIRCFREGLRFVPSCE